MVSPDIFTEKKCIIICRVTWQEKWQITQYVLKNRMFPQWKLSIYIRSSDILRSKFPALPFYTIKFLALLNIVHPWNIIMCGIAFQFSARRMRNFCWFDMSIWFLVSLVVYWQLLRNLLLCSLPDGLLSYMTCPS